jgi:hypothetical protein
MWNATAEPFVWTASADGILAKLQPIQTDIRKLAQNNSKHRKHVHGTLESTSLLCSTATGL